MTDLVAGDPKYDNAPAIAERFARSEPLPAGVFYCASTIEVPPGVGGALVGVCGPDQARRDNAWRGREVTVLVYTGPSGGTLVRIRASATRMENIMLCGGPITNWPPAHPDVTLIELDQNGAAWPVGDNSYTRVTLANARRGWRLLETPGTGGHCDHQRITDCITDHVDWPFTAEENQSVNHVIRNLVCKNGGRVALDFVQGGKLHECSLMLLGEWDAVLGLGDAERQCGPTINCGYYRIDLSLDGSTRIAHNVIERYDNEWARAIVEITGFAPRAATLGDPVLMPAPQSDVRVHVRKTFSGGDIRWPK